MPNFTDAQLIQFLDLVFDHVCAQRLDALMEPERLLQGLDLAATPERLAIGNNACSCPCVHA